MSNSSDFTSYDDNALGPIGRADAALLAALCQYVRPGNVVEYGGREGHSALILAANAGHVWSVEADPTALLHDRVAQLPNITLVHGDMRKWVPRDVAPVDLAFFDAAHDVASDLLAYGLLREHLAPDALIVVHDTADWAPEFMTSAHRDFAGGRREHVANERAFVNWLAGADWHPLSLASRRALRHGLSILQRRPW